MSAINKTIKYYKIIPNPTFQFYETTGNPLDKQTYNMFLMVFPAEGYYEHEYEKQKYGFDVIEMTKEYFFASCSISNNITPTSFIQIRDTKTKQSEPFHIDNLEKYTYMLLNFHKNRMVVMSGTGLSKITEVLVDHMATSTKNDVNISILPEKIEDFEKNAKRFSRIKNIEFKVIDTSYSNVPDLKSLLEDCCIENYSINFKLSESKTGLLNQLRKMKGNPKIQGIKAYGKNEFDIDDVIDYFATQFTRTIPININDENALSQEYIKNKLISVLD